MIRALPAALVVLLAAPISKEGFRLDLPKGFTESPKLTAASKERLPPESVEGGAIAWEHPESRVIARVIWLRSKYPSGAGIRVRDELTSAHDAFKSEAEEGRVESWELKETKATMTSTLVYRSGDAMEGKAKSIRQVAIAGVDKKGHVRAWTLECGYPSAAAAKGEPACAALAKSFALTLGDADFRPIENPKSQRVIEGAARGAGDASPKGERVIEPKKR